MTEQFLEEFLKESTEQITALNNALLSLESEPNDEDAMEEIFRTAHTLKGNFAAMGFDAPSDLAHAIEDLLMAVRDGETTVSPAMMDHIFEAVDQLERALDQIAATGEATIEPAETIETLHTQVDDTPATAEGTAPSDTPDATVTLTVTIDPGELKGVDALLVLEHLEETMAILETTPARERIEEGDFEDTFDVVVDAPDEQTAREKALTAPPVTDVTTSTQATPPEASAQRADTGGGIDEIETVRIDVDHLDRLYRLVEQFVTGHVRLERGIEAGDIEQLDTEVDELGKTTQALQDTVIDMRLVPFETIVGKFPRLVRDLAREQGKDIEFTIDGTDVEIDRSILTDLGDPLTHLLRNAVDHGIEPPGERAAAGKPETGTIELRARRARDRVIVAISDDGRGLDPAAIRETARERGVKPPEELAALEDEDLYELIFHPGFSTATEVTDVSGRGVGMDVVNDTIASLDGTIDVDSEPGAGTTIRLEVPVTMAIVEVLILEVGTEEYGIPVRYVGDIAPGTASRQLDGAAVLEHDAELYPIVDLADRFDVPETGPDAGDIVRIDPTERTLAVRCDRVRSQQTVVVKPLEGVLSGLPGISGTAILGDGEIMYLLDIETV